jgi:phosphorylcholine metabolism protein LicD
MEIPKDCNDYNLPEMYLNELYLLLKRTTDLCHEHNIQYWIDGGTLLGCVREKGQIPYDNDTDLGMLQDDYTKFRNICEPILKREFNYFIKESNVGFLKILSAVCGLQHTEDENNIVSPCLDIIVYHNFNGIIAIKDRLTRHMYSKFRFLENNLFPLKKDYIYFDLVLHGSANPFPYLERCYGDWSKRIYELKEYEQ